MRSLALALMVLGCAAPLPPPSEGTHEPRDAAIPPPFGAVGTTAPTPPPTPRPEPADECSARLLVIFDRSGSMNETWPDAGEPRYRVAADALSEAIAPLSPYLAVGAILFPSGGAPDPGACAIVDPIEAQIPYQSGASFLAAWDAYFRYATGGGSTPLDAAFTQADHALADVDGVSAVVVLTDGQPTCRQAVGAAEHAWLWRERGIKTWVVGLPGLSEAGVLSDVAYAGGTESYLPVAEPEALTAQLQTIVAGAVSQACDE